MKNAQYCIFVHAGERGYKSTPSLDQYVLFFVGLPKSDITCGPTWCSRYHQDIFSRPWKNWWSHMTMIMNIIRHLHWVNITHKNGYRRTQTKRRKMVGHSSTWNKRNHRFTFQIWGIYISLGTHITATKHSLLSWIFAPGWFVLHTYITNYIYLYSLHTVMLLCFWVMTIFLPLP